MHKFLIILFLFVLPSQLYSATLFFDPPGKNIQKGERLTIDFNIRVEKSEFINAIEGTIKFPKNILGVATIDLNDSVISAWIKEPQIKGGEITFSGVIPGGFDGVRKPLETEKYPGNLFKIIFETKKAGSAAVVIDEILVLKNDGLGSEAESSTIPFAVNVLPSREDSNTLDVKWLAIIAIITLLSITVANKIRREQKF